MPTLIPYGGSTAGVKLPVDKPLFRIGRDPANDLCIDDELVSREHAVIEQLESREKAGASHWLLRDLGSTNGTYVNNEKITERPLVSGDMIRVGKSFLLYLGDGADAEIDLSATTKLHKTFIPGVYYTRREGEDKKKK